MIINAGRRYRRTDFTQFGLRLGPVVPNDSGSSAAQIQQTLWANTTTNSPIIGSAETGDPKNIGVKWNRIRVQATITPDDTIAQYFDYPMNYPGKIEWALFATTSDKPFNTFAFMNAKPLKSTLPVPEYPWTRDWLTTVINDEQIIDWGTGPINPQRFQNNKTDFVSPIYQMTVAVALGEGGGTFTTVRDISLSSFLKSYSGGDNTCMKIDVDHYFLEGGQVVLPNAQLRLAIRLFTDQERPDWWYDLGFENEYGDPVAQVAVDGICQVDYTE